MKKRNRSHPCRIEVKTEKKANETKYFVHIEHFAAMFSSIKLIIASPKNSYYDPVCGAMDLTFITPQIVVSSGPVDKSWKRIYKLTASELLAWLDTRVERNKTKDWHVWNFKLEDSGGYSRDKFRGKVSYHPFPDHEPPALEIVIRAVKEIDEFLADSVSNLAVMHCTAGKGRTGTICCAYLMYKDYIETKGEFSVTKTIDFYTAKRMKPFANKGVSIRSQCRYLEYWGIFLDSPEVKKSVSTFNRVSIERITIRGLLVNVFDLKINFKRAGEARLKEAFRLNKNNCSIEVDGTTTHISLKVVVDFQDIKITFHDLCYFWFNIVLEGSQFLITWIEIDGFNGWNQRGPKMFDLMEISWIN